MDKQKGLSAAVLKNTAIILMAINHFSVGLITAGIIDRACRYANFQWYLTRAAFILFAFQIAEGMVHTKSRTKYLLQLLGMGIASEYFYDELFCGGFPYWPMQNVFFTLFFGALAIALIDRFRTKPVLAILMTVAVTAAATFIDSDYGIMGVAVILLFYYLRGKPVPMFLSVAVSIFALWFVQYRVVYLLIGREFLLADAIESCLMELHGILAFPLIFFYNGKKGKQLPKAFYYLFYPVHLLLILIIVSLLSK